MTQYDLRTATGADESAISTLLQASYSSLMREAYPAETLARVLPRMTRANLALLESGTFYLAVSNEGQVVSCGGWTLTAPGTSVVTEGLAHIRHFATHPDHLRKGLARRIFERCREAARDAGASRFRCYSSLNGEKFYASVGLVTQRLEQISLGDGLVITAMVMEGPVEPAPPEHR